jgi:hypothetical protein
MYVSICILHYGPIERTSTTNLSYYTKQMEYIPLQEFFVSLFFFFLFLVRKYIQKRDTLNRRGIFYTTNGERGRMRETSKNAVE